MSSLAFDKKYIRENVNSAFVAENCEIIGRSYLQNRDNGTSLENKVMHIKILACTNGSASSQFQYNTHQFGNKKQKLASKNYTYNRFFLCADLSSPSTCVAIITQTTGETHELLKLTYGSVFVGTDFYIHEPNLTNRTIGKSLLPVMSLSRKSLLPLKDSVLPSQDTGEISVPSGVGECAYFIKRDVHVTFFRIRVPDDVSCAGVQCDRQKPTGGCTCMHNGPGLAMIYEFDVAIPNSQELQMGKDNFVSDGFRSLRTTSVFFHDFTKHANETTREIEDAAQSVRRGQIRAMVGHINENGGWQIVGWSKMGEVSDHAHETETVENRELTYHISYLYPQDPAIIQTEAFQRLQIGNPTSRGDGDE